MSHSPDAPAASLESGGADDPDSNEGPGRGLFSRLREVFAPPEQSPAAVISKAALARATEIISLRNLRVDDVAVPKSDIVAVPVGIGFDDLVQVFRDNGLTRIPVYDGSLDSPLGLVNLKDFALRHGFRQDGGADFDLRALLRPLLFVPPSMRASVLLQKMQADRIHMALVIDEYGGTDGLATLEDLVETVFGEIDDEHDLDEGAGIEPAGPGVWTVKANTELVDVERVIGRQLTDHAAIDAEEIDTIGGLVFMLAGHVPTKGEVIRHPEGPEFEVVEADPRRIHALRLRLPEDWTAARDD